MNLIDVDIEQTTQEISANIETLTSVYWGNIAGNISSQTDLQNALNTKFDKTGGDIDGVTSITAVSTGPHSTTPVLKLGSRLENQTESSYYASIFMAPTTSALYIYNNVYVSGLVPTSSTSGVLGTSGFQWDSAYIKNLKIYNSGTIYSIAVPSQNGTLVVATPPETDGVYVLKCSVQNGVKTYEWVEE